MHDYVGLVRYAPPELVLKPVQPMPAEFCRETAATLKSLTGMNWQVTTSDGPAEPSLLEQEQAADAEAKQAVMDTPIVKAALAAFPDAELKWPLDENEKWSAIACRISTKLSVWAKKYRPSWKRPTPTWTSENLRA